MLEFLLILTVVKGNRNNLKLLQVFTGHFMEMICQIGWILREEVLTQPPVDECLFSSHSLMMNIIIWKCRGAQKPSFLPSARDLVTDHDPAIMVIMETQVGGDRAK